jgi:DNA polymerase
VSADLYLDTETYSAVPIKNGTYRYSEGAEIILWSWAIDDNEVDVWDVYAGDPMPAELRCALEDERIRIIAHEAQFDRVIITGQIEALDLPPETAMLDRWWCTAAQARAHSMPGALGKLCSILNVPTADSKMEGGKDMISMFCKPQKGGKRITYLDEPAEWERFKDYCALDTVAMREVRKRLPQWNYGTRGAAGEAGIRRWHLDQRINDRGFSVDQKLATEAVAAVEREKLRINLRGAELLGQDIKMTQRDKLLAALLEEFGVSLPDMKADTLERRINDDNLPDDVRELLSLRLQASTASVAKYKALLRSVTGDGRLHGTALWCGAQRTGRKSGRLFQHQNLSRVPKHLVKTYDLTAEMIRDGAIDLAPPIEVKKDGTLIQHSAMETMGAMVRACIVAEPGKKLCIADLSNIEGRDMAYFANETWKLDAFRAYDADPDNMERDLYILAYANSFKVSPYSVAQDYKEGGILRQIGKVQELALQYWGGLRAAKKMAAIYGVELSDSRWKEIIDAWREANRNIMEFSGALEDAFRFAIRHPGQPRRVSNGRIVIQRDGAYLRMRLPSGRTLCYPNPQVDDDGIISYAGINAYSRKWERISTYGGKIGENYVQASSADFMMENEEVIEDAMYDIIFDVHDEVATEVEDDPRFSGGELARLLSTARPWAPGFPLAAKGSETKRYRKD